MKKICVILNPNAKKFRLHKSSIDNYTRIRYNDLSIFQPADIDELENNIQQIFNDRPDYICIGGGDGTIHIVLTELINRYKPMQVPPVLILKEGTMDNIARSVHLDGHGEEILSRMINAIIKNKEITIIRRDTIEINNRYCFIFGLGFITNFLKLVYSGGEKGTLRNTYVGAKTLVEALLNTTEGEVFTNMDFSIEADGNRIEIHPVMGLLSGTVEHIGMGFSPLIDATENPGKFQTIILGMEPRHVLLNISKLKHGDKISEPGYANFHSSSMSLRYDKKFEYTMDGDIYTADRELIVKSGPAIDLVKV